MLAERFVIPVAKMAYADLVAPAVLLFGDDAHRRAGLAAQVSDAGGRVVASGPIDGALERIGRQAGIAGILLDLVEDAGPAMDELLAQVGAMARIGRIECVILVRPSLIDLVMARVSGSMVNLLVDPDAAETGAALEVMLAPRGANLSDSASDSSERRLAQLSEEVGRIARTLASLSDEGRRLRSSASQAGSPGEAAPLTNASDGTMIRTILRLRRLRDQHFDPALFADPAWDILLDLTAAQIEQRPVGVSSLCIAAAVPPTTALRWITLMTEQGILVRQPDPKDGRRVFMALGETASTAMEGYVGAARRVMAPVA